MHSFKHKLTAFLFVAAAFVAAADLATTAGGTPLARQKQQQPSESAASVAPTQPSDVRPGAAVRERRLGDAATIEAAETNSALFVPAAARNLSLKDELDWTFGGKQQRGWSLYVPLIRRTLGTGAGAGAPEFASALARWQTRAGLAPTGVLDDETLYQMISAWQSARIKERSYPPPDQLLVAPVSDFYDPTRPDELRQVERRAYAAYKRMVAAAATDPTLGLALTKTGELAPEEKFLKIVSSFRSREYQEKLRKDSPHAGRAGLAVNSPHFTGCALDIYVGGDPVETKDANRAFQVETRVYRWLVRNAESFGFRPYYYEPWHWEYVGEPVGEPIGEPVAEKK